MWFEIEDTRNIEALLLKKTASPVHPTSKNSSKAMDKRKTGKMNPKTADSWANTKIARRAAWVFLLLLILLVIAMTIFNSYNQQQLETLNSLSDTRLLSYESQIVTVKKLEHLFKIHDDDSYQFAKSTINMSDELRSQYFPREKYKGTVSDEEIVVEFDSIQYEITENDTVHYLVYLTRTQGTDIRQYILLAEYQGLKLVNLTTLL